jgi:Htaa
LATSLLALGATCALGAVIAAPAGAFHASGDAVVVSASHDSGRTLSGQGVKLVAGNGGSSQANKLTLPVADVNPLGTQPTATSAASLIFKKGKASVAFSDVRFNLSAGTIAGKLAGTETSIFRVEGAPQVNAITGAVSLSAGKLRLIGTTAQNLRSELDLERALNPKGVGMVWLAAQAKPLQVKKAVASGALDWGFLSSWREYIYKPLGPNTVGSITTEGGATTVGEPAKPGTYFAFPAAGGTYEEGLFGAASTLALKTDGSVKFAKPGHCIIEIRLANMEAKIEGASSAIVGNLTYNIDKFNGIGCEDLPAVSAPNTTIATLNPSGIAPSRAGNTLTWANVPATLTAAAAKPFEPQYKAGQALDPVTITVGLG